MKRLLKQEIIKLRQNGKNYNQIKKELKCSLGTISYYCNKLGIGNHGENQKPSAELIAKMREFYASGMIIRKISPIVGYSRGTIARYLTGVTRKKVTRTISVVGWRKRVKQKLVAERGGKCERCGYGKCMGALTFHHRNSKEKDFSISGKSWSFERLKKEADKCDLLCANCHVEVHEEINLVDSLTG